MNLIKKNMNTKRKIPQSILDYQFLIRKYLKPERYENQPYPTRELGIAKKLLQKYTIEFWIRTNLNFKLNSLAWFLSPRGIEFLEEEVEEVKIEQMLLNFDGNKDIDVLLSVKCGEDVVIENKKENKNLLDFLN